MVEGRSEKETELLNAFAESYLNAQHWSTRRQILSLMADKLPIKEMREFIPVTISTMSHVNNVMTNRKYCVP